MGLRARIGIDFGGKLRLEQALTWAAANECSYVDVCLDSPPNELSAFDDRRVRAIRTALDRARHPPRSAHALRGQRRRDLAFSPRCGRHLSLRLHGPRGAARRRLDRGPRRLSFHERLSSAASRPRSSGCSAPPAMPSAAGVQLLLENMNREPDDAEVHYLGHDVAECRYFFDQLTSPTPRLGLHRQPRPHAARGHRGLHPPVRSRPLRRGPARRQPRRQGGAPLSGPGHDRLQGDVRSDRGGGLPKHYMLAFGSIEDMRRGRDDLVAIAGRG